MSNYIANFKFNKNKLNFCGEVSKNKLQGNLIINASGPQGKPGKGVPAGGTQGQVLAKSSDEDYQTEWVTTHFTYEQGIASDTWLITHNLNKKPAIEIVDSADTIITGYKAQYNDLNTVTISFNGAFTGKAYLN